MKIVRMGSKCAFGQWDGREIGSEMGFPAYSPHCSNHAESRWIAGSGRSGEIGADRSGIALECAEIARLSKMVRMDLKVFQSV